MGWAKPVFDIATAVAAIIAPFLTILGWRYVSRNERRLSLVMDGRADILIRTGAYVDFVRDLRNALERAGRKPADPARLAELRDLLTREADSWIQMVQTRDMEAVFPQMRPIREAVVQNHYRILLPLVREALGSSRPSDFKAAATVAAEFVQGLLALRVAVSNSVTRTLFLRHRYSLADPEVQFGVIAIPESEYYGKSSFGGRFREWIRPASRRRFVWLLSGATLVSDAWCYRASATLDSGLGGGARPRSWRPLRYSEVGRPEGVRRLSALYSSTGE